MRTLLLTLLGTALLSATPAMAQSTEEDVEVLLNTVTNLLEALIQQGVLTPEAVETMIADAEDKALETVQARREQAASEEGAVRVTFVPDVVKDEISEQVAATVTPEVVDRVVTRARDEEWGIPGALPDWVNTFAWSADVRLRAEAFLYGEDNAENFYRNFQEINTQGGFFGPNTVLNTTEDRYRLRARVRMGFQAALRNRTTVGVRIATGDIESPVSTTTTLGNYGRRRDFSLDLAYINFDRGGRPGVPALSFTTGRMQNPWYRTDLAFDNDLNLDGVTAMTRLPIGNGLLASPLWSNATGSHLFFGAGFYTLEEIELSGDDKRLYSGQLGGHLALSDVWQFDFGLAYHFFENVAGERNEPNSNLLDFTAPGFVTVGNTLFDIRNDTDPNTALFALASDFEIAAIAAGLTWRNAGHELTFQAEYLENLGYDEAEVLRRTGVIVPERTTGYEVGFRYTALDPIRAQSRWFASLRYKYLERDAMIDGFAESVFRRGGTDAQGWIATGGVSLNRNSRLQLRWLSADEIDGAPYALDTVQFDLLTAF